MVWPMQGPSVLVLSGEEVPTPELDVVSLSRLSSDGDGSDPCWSGEFLDRRLDDSRLDCKRGVLTACLEMGVVRALRRVALHSSHACSRQSSGRSDHFDQTQDGPEPVACQKPAEHGGRHPRRP